MTTASAAVAALIASPDPAAKAVVSRVRAKIDVLKSAPQLTMKFPMPGYTKLLEAKSCAETALSDNGFASSDHIAFLLVQTLYADENDDATATAITDKL